MKSWFQTEDCWAVWVGLIIFALSLGLLAGVDALGWGVATKVWLHPEQALAPASPAYAAAGLTGLASLFLTYLFLLAVLGVGAWALGYRLPRFLAGFTVIFAVSYLCFLVGHFAYIAATPDQLAPKNPKGFPIPWSLGLTGEAGFILALLVGLAIGNLSPGLTAWLKEATRPEWFIKTAIVILGAAAAVKAADETVLAGAVLFRGFAAIIEAYLIYWALVYFVARRFFGFTREWAAPLASGISICGVSAAIATGAAIRARPIVPIMVSSLVVIFAVFELLLLPFIAQATLFHEPLVAGAWMGLAVKTDGAAVASGKITEALILAKAQNELGVTYDKEWVTATATTVKVFIDVFIGVWAFVLAIVWVRCIDKRKDDKVRLREVWERFPKFVIGYFLTFGVLFALLIIAGQQQTPSEHAQLLGKAKRAIGESEPFRGLFFVMTFFTIGLTANFKKLWAEGIGRLALVYVISLFGFIIWIGLAISWVFFNGVRPPVVGGP
jgi:uncharacterized membrane protein YadS